MNMLYCRQCGDVTVHRREAVGGIVGGIGPEKCAKCGRVADDHEAPVTDFGMASFAARETRYLAFMRWLVVKGFVDEEEGRPIPLRAQPITLYGRPGTIIMRYDRSRRY